MKKIVLFPLLLLLVLANSCSSTFSGNIERDGEDVKVYEGLLSKFNNFNPDWPIFVAEDSSWMKNWRLNDATYELEEDVFPGQYAHFIDFAGHSFQIFQAEIDSNDYVLKVDWLADITDQPKLKQLRENIIIAKKNQDKFIANQDGYRPISDGIWCLAYNTNNVNDEFREPMLLSWEIHPGNKVIQVYQFSEEIRQATIIKDIKPNVTQIIIDKDQGDMIQFKMENLKGQSFYLDIKPSFNNNSEIIRLDNLTIEPFPNYIQTGGELPKYILRIGDAVATRVDNNSLEINKVKAKVDRNERRMNGFMNNWSNRINKLENLHMEQESEVRSDEYEYYGVIRQANFANPIYKDGYFSVNCSDLLEVDNPEYDGLYRELVRIGAIGSKKQGTVAVPKALLLKFPSIYEDYRDRIKYPTKSVGTDVESGNLERPLTLDELGELLEHFKFGIGPGQFSWDLAKANPSDWWNSYKERVERLKANKP